jgi:hypothetical protein
MTVDDDVRERLQDLVDSGVVREFHFSPSPTFGKGSLEPPTRRLSIILRADDVEACQDAIMQRLSGLPVQVMIHPKPKRADAHNL